jgi:hypothetical protein
MQVKNLATGETEGMRYGAAVEAVNAGTHEYVNEAGTPADGAPADDAVDLNSMTKDQLLAEAAKRGVEVKPTDNKAEIIKAIEAK